MHQNFIYSQDTRAPLRGSTQQFEALRCQTAHRLWRFNQSDFPQFFPLRFGGNYTWNKTNVMMQFVHHRSPAA